MCGCDLIKAERMITGLSVLFLPREGAFVQSRSVHKHTPRFPSNKVYYVGAAPYGSDDNHSGTTEAAAEGTSESVGAPGRSENPNPTKQSHSYKVAQRVACSLSLHRKRGVNEP